MDLPDINCRVIWATCFLRTDPRPEPPRHRLFGPMRRTPLLDYQQRLFDSYRDWFGAQATAYAIEIMALEETA